MTAVAEGNFSGKHLVVFGCGYIGGCVAEQALTRGLRVTALTRNAEKAEALRARGVGTIVAELAETAWHSAITGDVHFVLNCVSAGGGGIEGYRRSYVDGMVSVLGWARARGGVGTIVYTSSTSVYPQGDGAIVDETSPTDGDEERARLLLRAEEMLCDDTVAAPRWFILRLAGIYGPGRHHLLEQVRSGVIAGVGTHRLNLAHRDDIAAAVWACLGAGPGMTSEIFNVADDAPASKAEVVAWLAARLGVPAPRFTGEPAVGRRAITPDRVIANGKLQRWLGWRPQFPTFRHGYENLLSR